ncbi:hypothetical protein E2542_SST00349 [Spatholobus suberectus]|nr:hypothetical protein E2542_SST00349 [Spatholobus suberectus]
MDLLIICKHLYIDRYNIHKASTKAQKKKIINQSHSYKTESIARCISLLLDWGEGSSLDQLGPQQLKYMTVRRDSSACFSFSLLAALKAGEVEKNRACFEEAESLRDFMVESHFEPWSFMP